MTRAPRARSIYRSYLKSPWESPPARLGGGGGGGYGPQSPRRALGGGAGAPGSDPVGVLGVGERPSTVQGGFYPFPSSVSGEGEQVLQLLQLFRSEQSRAFGISKQLGVGDRRFEPTPPQPHI